MLLNKYSYEKSTSGHLFFSAYASPALVLILRMQKRQYFFKILPLEETRGFMGQTEQFLRTVPNPKSVTAETTR